jgi:hypothetical protein
MIVSATSIMRGASDSRCPQRGGCVADDRESLQELLLEEYRTLRQESLDSLGHRLTVVNFTFAALSVVIAAMLASNAPSPALLAIFGLLLVPQGAKAGLFIWLGEYQRSQRAGRHIAHLEQRLNELAAAADGEGMSWESGLKNRQAHMSTPYIATIAFTIGAGWAGALVGIWYAALALRERLDGIAVGIVISAILLLIGVWEAIALRRFLAEWRAARVGPDGA